MLVRPISENELEIVVKIHLLAFNNFFLSKMGSSFLFTYYRAFLRNRNSVFLGCYQDNKLLGFCAASTLSKGFNFLLIKQNLFAFTIQGIKVLFSKPTALVHLYRNFSKNGSVQFDNQNYAELYSIGVSPEFQGKGVGRILFNNLESSLQRKACEHLSLTTDQLNNDKTLSFYKGIGFNILYEFTSYPNRKMYRLIKKL